MNPTAILIVHPERIVRESLSVMLTQHEDLTVIGMEDGREGAALIERIREGRADVVVLHSVLARQYGVSFITDAKFAAPDTHVLVTGVPDRDTDILAMIEVGVAACETEASSLQDLIAHIRALRSGRFICSLRVASVYFSQIVTQPRGFVSEPIEHEPSLTQRELQILQLIEAGLANKEIARSLSLQVQTVKNHVHNILNKLAVPRRIQAVHYARAHGLLCERTSTSTSRTFGEVGH